MICDRKKLRGALARPWPIWLMHKSVTGC